MARHSSGQIVDTGKALKIKSALSSLPEQLRKLQEP
jgi:hypothetical protein